MAATHAAPPHATPVPGRPVPKLPTDKQRTAHHLRTVQGLSDREVGRVMGVTRESANRLINAYARREAEIRRLCAARGDCLMLALLGRAN